MNEITIYECDICKNLVYLLHDGKGKMVCCNTPMTKLEAGSEDASQEKHVPAPTRNGNVLDVVVGSVEHPMIPVHYITWIAAVQGDHVQFAHLTPDDEPKASFNIKPGDVRVYAHCNLHGLWSAEA